MTKQTTKAKTPSPQSLTTLEALQARVLRGLALRTRQERGQTLALAEQFLAKGLPRLSPRQALRAEEIIEPLRKACQAPEGPQRAPATVGQLRTLIADLSDDLRIEALPGASPEWVASVVKLLALVPPVQRFSPGASAIAQKPGDRFNRFNTTPSAEDLGL